MNITDNEVSAIVKEAIAKLQLAEPEASLGIFDDMNEAIAAAKEAQKKSSRTSEKRRLKMPKFSLAWALKKRAWATSDIKF